MAAFKNKDGKQVLLAMVKAIQDNKAYLGDIDGLIGDGDHGMNMNKGFSVFKERFEDKNFDFAEGLSELGNILFSEIGGSMGPIYGSIFMGMADNITGKEEITLGDFRDMMQAGFDSLCEIIEARVGDKTLVDTLSPAIDSLNDSLQKGTDMAAALGAMKEAAERGKESTKDMVAKFGRSSRLGERSRGVLDAGATSCCIIISVMADEIQKLV